MHILFIRSLNPFFESSADANRHAGIISGLLKNKVKVTLVVTGGYNNFQEFKSKGLKFADSNLSVYYTTFFLNHNIWFRRVKHFILGGLFKIINQYKLKNFFKKEYDYIFLTKEKDILSAYNKYSDLIQCKSIIELNEFNDIFKGANSRKVHLVAAQKENDIFLEAVQKIDCFAVMTETLIKHYKKLSNPQAIFLHLPMTVDMSRFRDVVASDKYKKPYIAYTGTFNNAKDGVDILIKAFAKTATSHPEYHLYLAGFYHYDVAMQKELIAQLNLTDKVTYLNVLNKEEIPEFVCNADCLVLSRPDSRQAQGGFPTKLGEYLATGKPVCVTSVGEIPNYLEDNITAFMAIPGDVDSFADALERALSNKENAKEVGLMGRTVAEENFSIDLQAKRLVEFLENNLK